MPVLVVGVVAAVLLAIDYFSTSARRDFTSGTDESLVSIGFSSAWTGPVLSLSHGAW